MTRVSRAALTRNFRPEFFKALADESRLTLLARLALAARPLTVTEVGSCCGVHISGVSRHLALLKQAGLVSARKVGREVTYQLEFERTVVTLRQLADALESCQAKGSG